jgi:SAM-dependent methyltransferase
MSETDWEALYIKGDTRWEKGEPSPGLVDFLAMEKQLARGTVLVPGCGTGNDVCAWARAGFKVTGLDLAPAAVRLATERAKSAGVRADIRLGNFLQMKPFARFDWMFEHTLFCAINPAQRDDYVRALLRWLKPNGQFLAVQYMLRDEDGPPFGVTQQELMDRFAPHFELKRGWVPRSYPGRTGLELMLWWKRKPRRAKRATAPAQSSRKRPKT